MGKTPSSDFREFLSEFNNILIYFNDKNNDYCIKCTPTKQVDEYIKGKRSSFEQNKISNWISLYRRSKVGNFNKLSKKDEKRILEEFFVDFFQQSKINEIGENIEGILELIKNVIKNSDKKIEYEEIIGKVNEIKSKIKSQIIMKYKISNYKDNLYTEIEKLKIYYAKLDSMYTEIIDKLNISMENKVKIKFERYNSIKKFAYENLDNSLRMEFVTEVIKNKSEEILANILEKIDLFDLIDFNKDNIKRHIKKMYQLNSSEDVELDEEEKLKILDLINNSLKYMINNIERQSDYYNLSVKFNVNSFQENSSQVNYRELNKLSYGQRAVAILIIITQGLSAYNVDYPLIIDQPEDHLDNTFIFNNLVKEIRALKEKRQIILVTHNANIPISGDAENIICLNSDGEKGWIELNGPLDNEKIALKALNILEGGEKSFKRRGKKYKTLIHK